MSSGGSRSSGKSRLANLKGSDRQVAWATSIRQNAIDAMTSFKKNAIETSKKENMSDAMIKEGTARFDAIIKTLKSETSAKNFIDSFSRLRGKNWQADANSIMNTIYTAGRSGKGNDLEKKLVAIISKKI